MVSLSPCSSPAQLTAGPHARINTVATYRQRVAIGLGGKTDVEYVTPFMVSILSVVT
ncbi:hypothetical protein GCM10008094_21270 [Aidingimonas halophila]|nr:hypothetical protein GCM10008094_21270 [Aidingimonas halophila]